MGAVPRRIVWRCRRGTKELDLVLGQFLACGYSELDAASEQLFEEMLELQDTSLIEWLLYRQPPDPKYAEVVSRILQSDVERH